MTLLPVNGQDQLVSSCTSNNFLSFGFSCRELNEKILKENEVDDEICAEKKIQKSATKCDSCRRLKLSIALSHIFFCSFNLLL